MCPLRSVGQVWVAQFTAHYPVRLFRNTPAPNPRPTSSSSGRRQRGVRNAPMAGRSTTGTSTGGVARGLAHHAEPPPSLAPGSEAPFKVYTRRKNPPPSKDDYVPPRADDSSTSKKRTSKKRPCPAGQVQKPRKRPTKEDNSVPLFVKDVQKAFLAKDMEEQRKKRPASPTKNDSEEEPIPPTKRTRQDDGRGMPMSENSPSGGSFDSAGGGQQGTRTRDRSSVVHEVDKKYNIIMGDKGETRQHHPSLQNYIILKEKNPRSILRKIENLLSGASESCRDGKGCSFDVPSLSKKPEFVPGYGWAHKTGNLIRYDMRKKMRRRTVGLVCVLSLIAETIKKRISITNRHVYYSYMDHFGSQKVSDHMIASICCMLKCTKSSLMIVAEPKGSVAGNIEFVMKDKDKDNGDNRDSEEDKDSDIKLTSQRIPDLSEVQRIRLKADFMLIVEKKSMFHNLVQTKFHRRLKCILITGSGYPDMATRLLIKEISFHAKKLPIYALLDPDLHGLHMLLVYMFGSKNMSYDRMGMAIPSILWLPLEPNDLRIKGMSNAYFSEVTQREIAMLNTVLEEMPDLSISFQQVIVRMMEKKDKASLEALFSLGIEYVSKEFLPQMLEALPKISPFVTRGKGESRGDRAWDWNIVLTYAASSDGDEAMSNGDDDTFGIDTLGTHKDEDEDKGAAGGGDDDDADADDIEAFLKRSYSKAEVVEIDHNVLRIEQLLPIVTGGYMCDEVIDAYAHISVETNSKSFISTLHAEKLSGGGETGARQTIRWFNLIAKKCIGRNLVFVPLNINKNHWVLLVLNFLKKEVQILNSIASNPTFRDVKKEVTVVDRIQQCIDNSPGREAINIRQRGPPKMYSQIPQQRDGHSCGAFVLKYMIAWDGDKMTEHFTQADIDTFQRKICSELLQSDYNKRRLDSYKDPITKKAYEAKAKRAEVEGEDMSRAGDDAVKEISNPID